MIYSATLLAFSVFFRKRRVKRGVPQGAVSPVEWLQFMGPTGPDTKEVGFQIRGSDGKASGQEQEPDDSITKHVLFGHFEYGDRREENDQHA